MKKKKIITICITLILTTFFSTTLISADADISSGFRPTTEEEKQKYYEEGKGEVEYIEIVFDEDNPMRHSRAFISNPEMESRYKNSFKSVAWIYRSGEGYSLSIKPKSHINKEQSWKALEYQFLDKNPYASNPWIKALRSNPTSRKSMYNQYVCHIDFQGAVTIIKGGYTVNIEPHKPDKGYWGFVTTGCN